MKKTPLNLILIVIVAILIMVLIQILTSQLSIWLGESLTLSYFGWFASLLFGLIVIFREVSLWEIASKKLEIHTGYVCRNGFSLSLLMAKTNEILFYISLVLVIIFLIKPISAWVEKILGEPIILWLIFLVNSVVLLALLLTTRGFWEKISEENK